MRLEGKPGFGIAAIAVAALAFAFTAQAQSGAAPPAGGNIFYKQIGPGPGPLGDDAMQFVSFEGGLGGKIVTGAPFTATFSSQTTQALADGNRIQRTTSSNFARDGNGRTRQDLSLPAIGPWATSGSAPPHVVLINDPVASVHYALEPDKKIARKMPAPQWLKNGKGGPPPFARDSQSGVTTTSLGSQTMDGLTVQGTRTTRTIAAGAIGNQLPIQIGVDRWYSPDLQMNVMITRSDPRTGQTVFQVTNIQRGEPDASLFVVPSDYTVKQGSGGPKAFGRRKRGQGPPPPPAN